MRKKLITAFSLIEISIAILIIGILIASITKGSAIYYNMKLVGARSITNSSPVVKIKDLELWLETTSIDSFADQNLTDGDKIEKWLDINPQNTSKKHAIAYDLAVRPDYKTNSINNLPTLKFDGTKKCLKVDLDIRRRTVPNMTLFIVYENKKEPEYDLSNAKGILGNDGAWARWVLTYRATGPAMSTGNSPATLQAIGSIKRPQILTHISQVGVSRGSKVSINRNLASITYSEIISSSESTTLAIGSYHSACSSIGAITTPNIELGEIIIFSRVLNDPEIESIENYLSQKWGIKLIK